MLHTLINSPSRCDFPLLLRMLKTDDDILLLQDGVIAALEGTESLSSLLATSAAISVLQEDIAARGLEKHLSASVKSIKYNDFVTLSVKHTQQMVW